MNLFEKATKNKFRYPSIVGDLTTEQLWDLPLLSRRANQPDLDKVAQALAVSIRDLPEESFVRKGSNKNRVRLEECLEVVKHVIASKQAMEEAAVAREKKAARNARLREILQQRQDQALESLSEEEIQKLLQED